MTDDKEEEFAGIHDLIARKKRASNAANTFSAIKFVKHTMGYTEGKEGNVNSAIV